MKHKKIKIAAGVLGTLFISGIAFGYMLYNALDCFSRDIKMDKWICDVWDSDKDEYVFRGTMEECRKYVTEHDPANEHLCIL
jgi:hypothetical protein